LSIVVLASDGSLPLPLPFVFMRRLFSVLTALVIFLPALTAFASADFDYLMGDVQKFEAEMQMEEKSTQSDIDSYENELGNELIPGSADSRRRDSEQQREFEPFVSVRIDGVPVELTDVPSDAWFSPYVRDAAEKGIVSGYRGANGLPLGLFGPGDSVTIEQLAKIAVEASGETISSCTQGAMQNTSAVGSWSEPYILCAEKLGWAVYSDGSVIVQRAASRSEVVVTILQAFDIIFSRALGTVFSDVTNSTEFSGAIERAAADSIVSGYADTDGNLTGEFGPADPVNRAEIAKIISLALQVYGS
jgi:hypothetical protein